MQIFIVIMRMIIMCSVVIFSLSFENEEVQISFSFAHNFYNILRNNIIIILILN